jgi:prepilin-type N-terminal cleavage/methylation domain-containing protein
MTARSSREGGFTIFELMVVLTIISLLSSIAIPEMKRATLRTRAAERGTILKSMRMGIEDAYNRSLIPQPPGVTGGPNPPGVAGTTKRNFQNAMAGWSQINMTVKGDCYYTYEFSAAESPDVTVPAQYWVSGAGDLDGDAVLNTKLIVLSRGTVGGWQVTAEVPQAGLENDVGTF